jgi:hypothetical protein
MTILKPIAMRSDRVKKRVTVITIIISVIITTILKEVKTARLLIL